MTEWLIGGDSSIWRSKIDKSLVVNKVLKPGPFIEP